MFLKKQLINSDNYGMLIQKRRNENSVSVIRKRDNMKFPHTCIGKSAESNLQKTEDKV